MIVALPPLIEIVKSTGLDFRIKASVFCQVTTRNRALVFKNMGVDKIVVDEALVREMQEETGLEVAPLELLTVFDRIERQEGDVTFHYVIVDYRCRRLSGEVRAGSDALEARWAAPEDLDGLDLTPKAREVVAQAVRLAEAEALATAAEQE